MGFFGANQNIRMIKTRKQYEKTLDFLKINRFAYDEANEIDDLIEALSKMATAFAKWEDTLMPFGNEDDGIVHIGDEVLLDELLDKQAALPAWIKKDG